MNNSTQEYITYAQEVMNQFQREVEKEFGIKCTGSGGGMAHDVEVINMFFDADRTATVEEARELHVNCTEKLIFLMNSHEKIRPFLRKYPADKDNAHIMISFNRKKSPQGKNEYIEVMHLARGKIFYKIEDSKTGRYFSVLEEPYEEAVKIVQETK